MIEVIVDDAVDCGSEYLDQPEVPTENEEATEDLDLTDNLEPAEPGTKRRTSDPYTISEDGHIVGHDGFIIPKDFVEFRERFPLHVKNFVHARWTHASDSDREDREQDLWIHLMSLPPDAKHRQPGYNGIVDGCTDRIQVFNPESAYGASAKRFFWWINDILRKHYINRGKKSTTNPVGRANTMSLGSADAAGEIIDEEYVFSRIAKGSTTSRYYDYNNHRPLEESVIVNEFLEYVERHNPELLSVIEAIWQADSFVDAQRMLGMTEKLFSRARSRIVALDRHFKAGEVPPRQRKVYKSRKDMEGIDTTSLKMSRAYA
jgi:hypothetical protein